MMLVKCASCLALVSLLGLTTNPLPGCEVPASVVTAKAPIYPLAMRGLGFAGEVLVEVTIDATGALTGEDVFRSSGYPSMDRAALMAAKESTYAAGKHLCKPRGGSYIFRAKFGR
jgi:TonB family protein